MFTSLKVRTRRLLQIAASALSLAALGAVGSAALAYSGTIPESYSFADNASGSISVTLAVPTSSTGDGTINLQFAGDLDAFGDENLVITVDGTQISNQAWNQCELNSNAFTIPAAVLASAVADGSVTIVFAAGPQSGNFCTANGPLTANSYSLGVIGSLDFVESVPPPNLALAPAAGAVATGRINTPGYSQQFTASGGAAPYSYAITAGALPTGLTLTPGSGLLSGTPTQAGTFNFSVTATDSTGGAGSPFSITQAYSVVIYDVVQVTNASPLPNATVGTAYSQQMTASGGNGPAYTFGVSFGTLPAGLTLSSSGLLSGTPTAGGDFFFSIGATDPGGVTRSKNFPLTVNPPTIGIQPSTLNNATVGVLFNQTLAATGGTGPYTYQVTAGALPAGVTLGTNGALSGTPTAGGTFNFTVTATDSSTGTGPYTGNRAYTWTINAPTLAMTPASGALPGGQAGVAYSQTLTASGGTPGYTYAFDGGSPPPGMSITGNTLTGTPTASGSFSFSVRATDSSTGTGPYTVTNNYTLNVQQAVPTVISVAPPNGTTAGFTVVIITGTNFQNASAVTFGGTPATSYTVNNATTITAITPARAAGAVAVAVTTPGGTGTLANGYTYVAPGSVRFDVTSDENGSFVFTSATPGLNFTVNTVGGTGSSPTVTLQPGNYSLAFTTPSGFGLTSATCTPSTSTVSTSAKTAALVVASNVTTVCTIQSLASRQAAVEAIGTALDTSSRLIIANAPDVGRRLDRLNGGGSAEGTASAFGKTLASNLPFSATIGADELRFAMSLSGLRAQRSAHTFSAPANENGVPAALAASVEPGSAMAATDAAAAATAAITDRKGPRFEVWVEGVIAQFDAAASSDGSFMIAHAGADYLVTDNLLLGVGVQGDWLNMDTVTGSLDSQGWLAGPYLTARIAENLYLDARAARGGATFDVSPFNTYTDTVDSDRELYTAALIGEFKLGELLTVRPEGRVTWYKETTDSYIDSLSVFIPSVEIKTGEATFGPDFEWTLTRENGGVLSPKIGFDLIWTFQQDNTATAFTNAPGLNDTGVRGRIEGGLTYINPEGVTVGANLFYDGIGGGDYQSWGGTASLRFGF
jgi:hypothetical protein